MRVRALGLVMMLAAALLSACAPLTRAALYHPSGGRVAPGDVGLSQVREAVFTAPDGTALISWRADAAPGQPTVVYFHGNASNLANRGTFFRLFLDAGFGLAALSYRSFSGSQGRPSEAANIADALAFYDALVAESAVGGPSSLVLYGESLGSGVAVQVAAQRPVAGFVLHAPYDAVDDVAAAKAPYLLPRRLLTDRYRSIDHVPQISAPLLWLHGEDDRVIPLSHGQRLFDAATMEDKTAILVEGGHFDLYTAALFNTATAPFVRRVTQRDAG